MPDKSKERENAPATMNGNTALLIIDVQSAFFDKNDPVSAYRGGRATFEDQEADLAGEESRRTRHIHPARRG